MPNFSATVETIEEEMVGIIEKKDERKEAKKDVFINFFENFVLWKNWIFTFESKEKSKLGTAKKPVSKGNNKLKWKVRKPSNPLNITIIIDFLFLKTKEKRVIIKITGIIFSNKE